VPRQKVLGGSPHRGAGGHGAGRFHEGGAVVERVVGNEVAIGGDDGAKILAEGDVDSRAVVGARMRMWSTCSARDRLARQPSTRSGCSAPSGGSGAARGDPDQVAERRSTIG
jgi:hypothetical protein